MVKNYWYVDVQAWKVLTHVQTGLELQDKTGYRPINGSMDDMAF